MPKAEVSPNVELYYEIHGSGSKRVILIMGLNCTHKSWVPNVEGILAQDPDFQFLIFDNRGVGYSSVPPGRYTTKEMATDAMKLLDSIGWENEVHVVGISMGGMISQELALLIPERILSLSLCVTHTGSFSTILPPLKGLWTIMRNMVEKDDEKKIRNVVEILYSQNFLNQTVSEGKTMREFEVERLLANLKAIPVHPEGYVSQLRAVSTHKVEDTRLSTLNNYPFKTLIVHVTDDHLVAPKHSVHLSKILKNSELLTFDGCGHGVNIERLNDFNNALLNHFNSAPSSPSSSSSSSSSSLKLSDSDGFPTGRFPADSEIPESSQDI
eukprot:TRINITY_DN3063_c0_g1_i1.p1 TRINITY_DN3063_c0_g1~~TRINITY_DN3063_c0_g1_i1.p1  ORF type:complete len:348 (+),score=139.94 TRINITY_DN3063_c0_g1_i1:69-1046(+)